MHLKLHEIKEVRLALKWSQLRLAKALGVSQSVISYIEHGLVSISPSLQKRIDRLKQKYRFEEWSRSTNRANKGN